MLSSPQTIDGVEILRGSRPPGSNGRATSRAARIILLWVTVAAMLIAIAALLLVLPIRIPSTVSTYADITAARKWVLEKGTTGQLIARTINYQTGMSDGYRVSNFDGGTSIFFSISPFLKPGQQVAIGDTIGTVYSSDTQERLISLNGQLVAAERVLAVNATGAKSAVVEAAQQRLQAAKRRRVDYQPTVDRTDALLADHLVPQGEYDRVQGTAHALDDAIAIAQAELVAAQTGAKPEELALAESRIAALKEEISAIRSRAASYTIRAPIEGTISSTANGDMLLSIAPPSQYVALIAIRSSDYARVATAPNARVTIAGYSRPVRGRLLALGHDVQDRYGQKVVMATASLESPPDDLLPGSIARCKIECTPLTALDYGKFILHSIATSASAAGGI